MAWTAKAARSTAVRSEGRDARMMPSTGPAVDMPGALTTAAKHVAREAGPNGRTTAGGKRRSVSVSLSLNEEEEQSDEENTERLCKT